MPDTAAVVTISLPPMVIFTTASRYDVVSLCVHRMLLPHPNVAFVDKLCAYHRLGGSSVHEDICAIDAVDDPVALCSVRSLFGLPAVDGPLGATGGEMASLITSIAPHHRVIRFLGS